MHLFIFYFVLLKDGMINLYPYAQTYVCKSGPLNRLLDTLTSGHTYIWTSLHMERRTHEPVEEIDRQTY